MDWRGLRTGLPGPAVPIAFRRHPSGATKGSASCTASGVTHMSAADHNLSVLVVSEDSLELAGVRRRLQQRGHRVYSVTTAAAAAEACAQDAAFDVVVCDTVLPDS